MALDVKRVQVWSGSIKDQPGALAAKLAKLADAGANLEFVLARRKDDRRGRAIVFVGPIEGAAQGKAARKAGLARAKRLVSLRVAGADKPGLGACMAAAVGAAGVNMRGFSASVVGGKFVAYLALDKPADATVAARALRKL